MLCPILGYFWPVLFGTILQACAAPFIINCQQVICNKWFSDKERALATAMMAISMPMGTGLAFLLTGNYFADTDQTNEQNRDNLGDLLGSQSIIFTVVYVSFQLVFREKPEHPPSAIAEVPVEDKKFGDAFIAMKENKSFMYLNVAFALMFGFYLSLGNLISSIFTPFGFSPADLAMVGLQLLGSGIVGAVIVGIWIDRTKTFWYTTVVLCVMNVAMLCVVNQTLYYID